MTTSEKYIQWVERVVSFSEKTGRALNRCCSVMQSKPVLDKQPQVLFLGYNAQEDFGFVPIDKNRFYEGNSSFYSEERNKWRIWQRLYGAFKWAECLSPVTDGNFIFMNAVYFGTKNINQLKDIQQSKEAINQCLDFTSEVIQDIFKPKSIICFSIGECFSPLKKKFCFTEEKIITPKMTNGQPAGIKIYKAYWNEIPVYGIPHPSGRLNNDDMGAIALFFKEVL
ncbi:hypothetical protein ACILPE_04375 [Capnocytophaga canimorsus]|uniref:hypothetical protein n=1 Tax=Capnocytophaga canimorsus TaxID=28188 RepID=UPI0037CCCD03